jgi:hypothetical protein
MNPVNERQSGVDDDDDEYINILRRHVVQHTSDVTGNVVTRE